jgi:hypothetical protein
MINDLLDLARSGGRLRIDPEPTSVRHRWRQ